MGGKRTLRKPQFALNRPDVTLRKGLAFTAWLVLVMLSSPVWFFGPAERWGSVAAIPGAIFWLGHGAVTVRGFRCPQGGSSAFAAGSGIFVIYRPWPRRTCGRCGHDHSS